jgi:hypothetical protein
VARLHDRYDDDDDDEQNQQKDDDDDDEIQESTGVKITIV